MTPNKSRGVFYIYNSNLKINESLIMLLSLLDKNDTLLRLDSVLPGIQTIWFDVLSPKSGSEWLADKFID